MEYAAPHNKEPNLKSEVLMKKVVNKYFCTLLTLPLIVACSAVASDFIKEEVVEPGKLSASLRVRTEFVEDDAKNKDADASTIQVRVRYETKKVNGLQGFVEGQTVIDAYGDYNDTQNGKVEYPVVADPDGSQVHQMYFNYEAFGENNIRVGRQEIVYDNSRFIGNVGWRQNAQSFDSVLITNDFIPKVSVDVGYIDNVKNIKNNTDSMSTPIVRLSYSGLEYGKVVLYGYFVDYDEPKNEKKSNRTIGARFSGAYPVSKDNKLTYAAEYAEQKDYGDNPKSFNADYLLAEVGVSLDKWSGTLGYEVLGGDKGAQVGFMTPLATLHKFQGWADKFLVTPAEGIEDKYMTLKTTALPYGVSAAATYHEFNSDIGSTHYGDELDVTLVKKMKSGKLKGVVFVVKAAHYNADEHAEDTNKLVFQFTAPFN